MAPSEQAERMLREAEGGFAAAQYTLGVWHEQGLEGLEQDEVKAAAWFRKAADLGLARAEAALAGCYGTGQGVEQNYSLAADWGRKAADQGDTTAQFLVGKWYADGDGVKKDLPLGKTYLELSAAQGFERAVALLKELRKCVACGKLDVHHMICSQCRNRRYCDKGCQLWHWNSATDPHRLHCVKRCESAGEGGSSSERAGPRADSNQCEAEAEAAAAAMTAEAARVEAAKAAVEAASTASEAAKTAATAAWAAMLTAPAASKKGKKKKAKLGAKVKAAESAPAAAEALLAAVRRGAVARAGAGAAVL